MSKFYAVHPATTALAACILFGIGSIGPARAGIVTTDPSLPLLNTPYFSTTDAGCFALAAVCVSAGSLSMTSVGSSTFDGAGQEIVASATYTAMLTDLFGTPIGTVDLTGSIQETVQGRSSDTDTGLWATDVTGLSLSGTVLSETMTMSQDPDNASTGATSIADQGDGTYLVTSFFDMFVDLSLASAPPETVDSTPVYFDVTVPEPSSLALLCVPVFALAVLRRRKS